MYLSSQYLLSQFLYLLVVCISWNSLWVLALGQVVTHILCICYFQ